MQVVSVKDAATKLGVSRRTVYNMIDEGKLPRPLQISKRRVGWRESDLQSWLQNRAQH